MLGHDFDDHTELCPLGEATHVPDHELETDRTDQYRGPRRSHFSADDGPTSECRSCDTSLPTGRTKCRFCLSNRVEPLDVNDAAADETALLHVVHLVVPAASRYAAVAKGTTAASFVPQNGGTITGCDLIADLDDEPAQQLVKRWDALPAAVESTAEHGQRLFATARERAPEMGAGKPRGDCEGHATFLYDEVGHGIETNEYLTAFLEDASNDLWLLPALALSCTEGGDEDSKSKRRQGPK